MNSIHDLQPMQSPEIVTEAGGGRALMQLSGASVSRHRCLLRDNQKPTFSDNQPMHLMVEHASLGATPVKPKAAGGGGLKGQALRAQR
jgi:hypothetical protein